MRSVLHEPAVVEVRRWFSGFPNVEAMQSEALASYPAVRKIEAGWLVDLRSELGPDGLLRVMLTQKYPHAAPLIAVSPDKYLVWPHVERDGVLCLQSNAATHSAYKPVGVLTNLLNEAVRLTKACVDSSLQDDFRTEFHSYWSRETSEDERDAYSILEESRGSRLVTVWPGTAFFLIGETEQAVGGWLTKCFGEAGKPRRYEQALLIELDNALLPSEYPSSAAGVAALVNRVGGGSNQLFHSLLKSSSRPTVLLRAPTKNGMALAMVRLNTDPAPDLRGRRLDKSRRGFRPDKISPAMLDSRLLARARKPDRYEVVRADASWVHGRGRDLQAQTLFQKRVLLFGAGSVGGSVAEMLMQAGVGKLVIVDPERLVFANASRHILGADSVGVYKSMGVAKLLQKRFPHSDVSGVRSNLAGFISSAEAMEEWDLVISLTGDWSANTLLNEVFLRSASVKQLLIGWSEAHAVAGHAVLLRSREACLLCGYHADGLPRLRVADWEETTMQSEPACGGLFQPYGAVEIASVNAMVAGTALRGLIEDTTSDSHVIYAAEESVIRDTGGRLTEEWLSCTPGFPRDVKLTKAFAWSKRTNCEACGVGNATEG